MTSKEALEILFESYYGNYHAGNIAKEKLEQTIERAEKLEDEYINLREKYNDLKAKIKYHIEYAYNYLKECADE